MAHELDTRSNGAAAFVSLRRSAWHQLGTIAQDEMTYEEALTLGGLDYRVGLRPLVTTRPLFDADGKEYDSLEQAIPGIFAVMREDRGTVFATVRSRYEVVQNRDAMEVIDALVSQGLARIETAGALREGADAWIAVRFAGADFDRAAQDREDDVVNYYGVITANHNGKAPVRLITTPIRVVCANTLGFALGNKNSAIATVRHTKAARVRVIDEATRLWAGAASHATQFSALYRTLRATIITPAQFAAAVSDVLAPEPARTASENPREKALRDTLTEKAAGMRVQLVNLWLQGTGQDGTPTAWAAYNAATEALDHVAGFNPTRKGGEALTALLPGGTVATAKAEVFNNLLALAR
jgi:phage/plasmid-like protein (TIGR03299 family)